MFGLKAAAFGRKHPNEACQQEQDTYVCTADYQFPAPVETLQAECTLASVTVPNHVHLLRAYRGDKTDQAVFDLSYTQAEIRFRPPTAFETATREISAGFMRAAGGLAPLLFLVSLVLAARSRRELMALTASFLAAEALACAMAPRLQLPLSPRFIEAAAALTIAYLAFEIILLPQSEPAMAGGGGAGPVSRRVLRCVPDRKRISPGDVSDRRRYLRVASDRLIRLPSGSAGAPRRSCAARCRWPHRCCWPSASPGFSCACERRQSATCDHEGMRNFDSLSEREILALAISLEEEDERVYAEYAEGLRENFPASAEVFDGMREEESGHRRRLIELFRKKFGEHIPLIRRQDVRGFVHRNPVWLMQPLGLDTVRNQASAMEVESRRFYEKAAARAQDAGVRQLLDDLAQEERTHEDRAEELEKTKLQPDVKHREDEANRRLFVLQIVQPGLAGLMDGSVSTLAPVFAAALATQSSFDAFKVGLAASLGAGISMGFAEALSDDGSLTGRGHPWARGVVCGLMTALGGIGHTLPFLIPGFRLAMIVAALVVVVELGVISWIRHRYMDTPPVSAVLQVGLGRRAGVSDWRFDRKLLAPLA